MNGTVLATGGSGFAGSHVLLQRLSAGYKVLKARLGEQAKRVPTRKLPNFIVELIALFNVEMRDLVPLLGKARNATSAKAQRILGWKPRSWEDAVIATAESLLKLGVVDAK